MSNLQVIGNYDLTELHTDTRKFLDSIDGWDLDQISLTSISGNDDWFCSTGRLASLQRPEKHYCTLNKSLQGTYIEKLINNYPDYYRWRILRISPMSTYTVHCDSLNDKENIRIHIPIWTNRQCYFCFYSDKPDDGKEVTVEYHHLAEAKIYEVNTTLWHTAVNYSSEPRWHIVGVKYQ